VGRTRDRARILGISDQAVFYAGGVWSMLPWTPDAGAALRYARKIDPKYLVLDREYAGERPYITAWMATGVPDPAARTVFTIPERGTPQLTIVRWTGGSAR